VFSWHSISHLTAGVIFFRFIVYKSSRADFGIWKYHTSPAAGHWMLDAGFWMTEAASLIESETDKCLFILDFEF
jgi:hypothetical protein